MRQRELRELLPGAAGGLALAESRGAEYFRELGRRGGQRTRDRYGLAYMRALSLAGGLENRRRIYQLPATIRPWYGGTWRRIPWWAPRQRKRPILVRTLISEE